ncbi:MAG: hypothetical protein M1814_001455 [Vezdaea aestivalis]|nr:MAG: hypothetical protein M1814_001455 [Vezdaea aestivalis]
MPHANLLDSSAIQALILCGPGVSLTTFTSNPEEFPKALVPIANRPMVWYPLQWCYKAGISHVTLILPKSSRNAISQALSTNPYLTSLPSLRPTILTPEDLSPNSGTCEILRMQEVQACIKGDFMVLPCDLVCDIAADSLYEAWVTNEAGLTSGTYSSNRTTDTGPRRAGLGVWYNTKNEEIIKSEEKDLIATTALPNRLAEKRPNSVLASVGNLVYSAPMTTVKDIIDEKGSFPIRHGLLKRHGHVKIRTTYRDAHLYILPRWILEIVNGNEKMVSIAEDVIGWWAKSGWQPRLSSKLGFDLSSTAANEEDNENPNALPKRINLRDLTSSLSLKSVDSGKKATVNLASRVTPGTRAESLTRKHQSRGDVPPILAYIQPKHSDRKAEDPASGIIRRVDNTALLLSTSLQLAKLHGLDDLKNAQPSPFVHAAKIAYPAGIKSPSTVTSVDCLLADDVIVEERAVIKGSVLGVGCRIGRGARINRCLLMDGVVVGDQCQLSGCILGRRSRIGSGSILKDCEVQELYTVPPKTNAKNEVYMSSEGLDDYSGEDMAAVANG